MVTVFLGYYRNKKTGSTRFFLLQPTQCGSLDILRPKNVIQSTFEMSCILFKMSDGIGFLIVLFLYQLEIV